MTARHLPSDHQHKVLEQATNRGDGMILRYTHTSISTLNAMHRRGWINLIETTIERNGQLVREITGGSMTADGATALLRSRQHRTTRTPRAAHTGITTRLADPFAAYTPAAPLPF